MGVYQLGLRETNDVTASIVEEYRPEGFYNYFQYIPVVTGDDILGEIGLSSVSVLKIDVEGGELDVIKGMHSFIKMYTPYIFFEVLPHYLFATQCDLDEKTKEFRNGRNQEMDSVLKDHDYLIYQIRPNEGVKKINKISADNRQLFYYVAVPKNGGVQFCSPIRLAVLV